MNDTILNAVTITLDLLLKNGDFPLTTLGILNIFFLTYTLIFIFWVNFIHSLFIRPLDIFIHWRQQQKFYAMPIATKWKQYATSRTWQKILQIMCPRVWSWKRERCLIREEVCIMTLWKKRVVRFAWYGSKWFYYF